MLSFLQVQDGALATVGKVLDRMSELHHGSRHNQKLRRYRKLLERVSRTPNSTQPSQARKIQRNQLVCHLGNSPGMNNGGNTRPVAATEAGSTMVPRPQVPAWEAPTSTPMVTPCDTTSSAIPCILPPSGSRKTALLNVVNLQFVLL